MVHEAAPKEHKAPMRPCSVDEEQATGGKVRLYYIIINYIL